MNILPSLCHPSHGPGNSALENRPAVVVRRMNLVDDDQALKRDVGTLASDDIPFLGRRDDDLGFGDLGLTL